MPDTPPVVTDSLFCSTSAVPLVEDPFTATVEPFIPAPALEEEEVPFVVVVVEGCVK